MNTDDGNHSQLQEELQALRGSDPVLDHLMNKGPVTRESYLAFNFLDGVPNPMPAELEAQMPWPLRLGHLEHQC